jgi:hypothetical protein
MQLGAEELRGVLSTYRQVMEASWPNMHPAMADKSRHWARLDEGELRAELAGYLRESEKPGSSVRVFWKLGPKFLFGGCNELFARDAGLAVRDLIGTDDFDKRLPWAKQAAKYRADDSEVFNTGKANLDIIERQTSATGTVTWVRVGKAPIRKLTGEVIGILGMYELMDEATGTKLYSERLRDSSRSKR